MNNAILVVGPSWVGDMVMAQSLLINLRQHYPSHAIDVVAPAWSVDLLKRMPEVRDAYALNVGHGELGLGKRRRLGKQFRGKQYQRAIVLPRSFKSALVPFWADIPIRTGFRGEMRYGLLNDVRSLDSSLDQTVKRFVALGEEVACKSSELKCSQPRLKIDEQNAARVISELGLKSDKPIIGFMPGAEYGPAKQWPLNYFAELANKLAQDNYYVWVLGSQKEYELGTQIAQAKTEQVVNLCGKTQLVDVVDLVAKLSVAVSNDSGLMHVAAATGRPVIGIYGSSSPAFTPPLSDHAIIEYKNLSCSPCFKRECPFGHYNCLKEITPDSVFQRIKVIATESTEKHGN